MNSVFDISLKVSEVIAAAPSFKQIRLDEETGGFRLYFEAEFLVQRTSIINMTQKPANVEEDTTTVTFLNCMLLPRSRLAQLGPCLHPSNWISRISRNGVASCCFLNFQSVQEGRLVFGGNPDSGNRQPIVCSRSRQLERRRLSIGYPSSARFKSKSLKDGCCNQEQDQAGCFSCRERMG